MKKTFFLLKLISINILVLFQLSQAQFDSLGIFSVNVNANPEIKSKFPGGDAALNKFMVENLKYPPIASKYKVNGDVIVVFVVDTNGEIKFPATIQDNQQDLADEALRLFINMPKWIPAENNGVKIPSINVLKLKFFLEGSRVINNEYDWPIPYKIELADFYYKKGRYTAAMSLYNFLIYKSNTLGYENEVKKLAKDTTIKLLSRAEYFYRYGVCASKIGFEKEACEVFFKANEIDSTKVPKGVLQHCLVDSITSSFSDTLFHTALYNNGNPSLNKYIKDKIGRHAPINCPGECYVLFTFIVEENGNVTDPIILLDNIQILSSKIKTAIAEMPKWEPAILNNKKIPFRVFYIYNDYDFFMPNTDINNNSNCAFYEQALKLQEEGNYEKAIKKFNNALVTCNGKADVYIMRGSCFVKLNQLDKACEDFKKALELNDDRAKTLINKYCLN